MPATDNHTASRFVNVLAVSVAITVSLWLWLTMLSVVVGTYPGREPLIFVDQPVVRDVFRHLLLVLFAIATAWGVTRLYAVPSPTEWIGLRRPDRWGLGYIVLGTGVGIALLLGSVILIEGILGLERTGAGSTLSEAVLRSRILTLLIFVGPAEELLMRGVIQRSLREHIGPWPAIVLSGGLFGIAHLDLWALQTGDLLWLAGLGTVGIMLGWLYERTGNIVIPGIAHGGINSVTTLLPLLLG